MYLDSEYRRESRYLRALTAAASVLLILGGPPYEHSAYRAFTRARTDSRWYRHENAPAHPIGRSDPVAEQVRLDALGRSASWVVVPLCELPSWGFMHSREPLQRLWMHAKELAREA